VYLCNDKKPKRFGRLSEGLFKGIRRWFFKTPLSFFYDKGVFLLYMVCKTICATLFKM